MLKGHGQYAHPVHQAQTGLNAYFQQVLDLALMALRASTPQNSSTYFCNFIQQPRELFPDYMAYVNEAVECRVDACPN